MHHRRSPKSRSSKSRSRTTAQKTVNALALCVAATHGLGATAHAAGTGVDSIDGDAIRLPTVTVHDGSIANAVSSPKFTQPVADTPKTVSVIPPEVYTEQGATTLSDVVKNTPGITFFAGEGGSANRTGGDAFYLRGFDTSNSLYVDGVRDEGAAVHDVFDVGQVEVFKGPSPENGRGGTAGYVNLETKLPAIHPFADLQLVHGLSADGSRPNDRATLDVNEPLAASPLPGTAFRLNLVDQEGGVAGRQDAENDRWGVAPSLAVGLGTATRGYVSYEHLHEHNLPDYGVPATIEPGIAPAALGLYAPGVDPSTYYGFADFDREMVTVDAVTARIEHDFAEKTKLTEQVRSDATSRFVESTSPQGNSTTPAGEATLTHGIYATSNEILSEQTNLAAALETGPLHHDLTTGLELSRESSDNPTWAVTALGTPSPNYLVSLYQPNNFPGSLINYAPHPTGTLTNVRIDTAAWYGFDTIKLNRFWELSGGVRVEHYHVDEVSFTAATPAVPVLAAQPATATTPATAATTAVVAAPASAGELGSSRTTASWKGGLVFKPRDNGSVYVSYATTTRPPGTSGATNALSTTASSADNPLLRPETAVNYEAGTKWQCCDERVLATAAVFRSVNQNVPAADPTTGLVDQTSDQTVQGVELGVSGKVTDRWLLFAGYAHLEPKVSHEISTNAQGLTLPLLPKDTGNLWTTYAWPRGVQIGAGVQYMGATERLQATTAPTAATFANEVPAYWLGSAMVSYAVSKHLTFRLNVNNVGDRRYISSLNNNGYRLNLGAPRTWVLTGELRF